MIDRADFVEDQARWLARNPNAAAAVIPQLPGGLAREMRQLTAAARDLQRLSAGTPPRAKTGLPPSLADLESFYGEAHDRYGVGIHYLVAIHLVETKFGRVKSDSVAGAKGPMQFIPSTRADRWERRRHPRSARRDPRRRQPAPSQRRPATLRHGASRLQPSGLYVDAVTHYARAIVDDPYAIYILYSWKP